ncbi:hypothetical protein Val02_21080 [Virgisporangium aliadipatigenens]|uniref:Uncharacterized protein n=1 Tax=Virgisporangium aliadipatigenens TaxID=741659 RepID=A0A8J4DQB0_9ACTN|nr:hypothetical protein [Virgisporangium aliadipatigenens]GIJ45222.1 hypothetical protein Val02_21080 [Virgisporangium aliadipatigenens]
MSVRVRSFLISLPVIAVLYAAPVVAFVVWVSSLPADGGCAEEDGSACMPSYAGFLIVAIFYGIPALLLGLVVTAIALGVLIAVEIPSGLLAGFVATVAGWVVAVVVVGSLFVVTGGGG